MVKKLLCVVTLSACLISSNSAMALAESVQVDYSEDNAIGGWDEENGYFINRKAYSKMMQNIATLSSEPNHSGSVEDGSYNGTSRRRAHGYTTWYGVYHYTRARMEDHFLGKVTVLTDSGRQYGYDYTEAHSPWWNFDGHIKGSARSYYGSD